MSKKSEVTRTPVNWDRLQAGDGATFGIMKASLSSVSI